MSSSILEYITQTIYFDKDKYSKKEIDVATEKHKKPDPFIGLSISLSK